MTEQDRQFDDPELRISGRLRQDLRDLFEPPGAVPARTDKAILDQARRRLAQPRRLVLRLRWAGLAAAAAVILLGVVLYEAPGPRNFKSQISNLRSSRPVLAESRADVDGSGRVDILDAFRLARSIEARGSVDGTWDLNGDGRVDKADVDLVACAAVRLASHPVARRGRGEGVPPSRPEAILASVFPPPDASVAPKMQGPGSPNAICSRLGTHDALAANPIRSPLDKGV